MNINKAFPSKYLSAADLPDEGIIVTIHSVEMEKLGDGPADNKAICHFIEDKQTGGKGMLLNRTNAKVITGICGTSETDDWFGKRIRIFPTQTEFKGETVPCIRVDLRAPQAARAKINESLKKSLAAKNKRGGVLALAKA